MRILADTNLFIKFCHRQPLPSGVEAAFDDDQNELCLSVISAVEIYRLWKIGRLKDNPDIWLDEALPAWTILPMNFLIARQSVLWPWQHNDPADRILAATAKLEKTELWHTDTILKKLSGFPQRYFKNIVVK